MKASLLLIDDSQAQGGQIKAALERLGYAVVHAASGAEGLRLARELNPDLVLLDVVMPDLDGFAVCRWLKMNAATKHIPVIMLTVRATVADRVEGLQLGADDYLPKPFQDTELEARIFAALRVKNAHSELRERNMQLEAMLHQVEALAITDPLTGLFNRRRFGDVLKREFAVTKRYRNTLSCLLLDLDHFKRINDRFGHDAGDQVLKEVARRMTESLREVDLAARFGGEEFAILLPHTSKKDAAVVAARLLTKVRRQEFKFGSEVVQVTVSIGCAGNSDVSSENAEDLVKCADLALYEAKAAGRDRFVLFNGDSERAASLFPSSGAAPQMPFPASLPAPEGPFQVTVNVPGGSPLPRLGETTASSTDSSGEPGRKRS